MFGAERRPVKALTITALRASATLNGKPFFRQAYKRKGQFSVCLNAEYVFIEVPGLDIYQQRVVERLVGKNMRAEAACAGDPGEEMGRKDGIF